MSETSKDLKKVTISVNYDDGSMSLDFSDNLNDENEQGYILSSAFFSFAAAHGVTKEQMLDLIKEQYDNFSENN